MVLVPRVCANDGRVFSERMDKGVNLCKDCKYHRASGILFMREPGFDKCARVRSRINGKVGAFCDVERGDYAPLDVCGPDGKYFEPKPARVSFWKRWLAWGA